MHQLLILILSTSYCQGQSGSGSGELTIEFDATPMLIQKINGITPVLTGFSGGGEMSCMMHTIHSKTFHGAASVGGSSYASPMINSDYGKRPITKNLKIAKKMSNSGKIDNLKNLKNSRVYVLHATDDEVVPIYLGRKIKKYYKNISESVKVKEDIKRRLYFLQGYVDTHCRSALHGTNVGHAFESIKTAHGCAIKKMITVDATRLLQLAILKTFIKQRF